MAHYAHLEDTFAQNLPFHNLIRALIADEDLYDYMRDHPERKEQVRALTAETCARYRAGDEAYRFILHRTLGWLYEMQLYTADKKPVANQFDPTLLEVQRELEAAWMQFEDARVPTLQIPEDPAEFVEWFKKLVIYHEATDHPLFTYLEKQASLDDMRYFFLQEITIDARFDDLVAISQIGMDNYIKLEIAENYWDEMGNGDMNMVHTVMFNKLLDELNVISGDSILDLFDTLDWESLACGNTLLYTVLHRKNAYKALGSMGTVEMISPLRFHRLVEGFARLGLSEQAQQYHTLHIQIDARHGNGWLRNAIGPAVEADRALRYDIVKGAFYRLNTSMDYCNKLYDRFCARQLAA